MGKFKRKSSPTSPDPDEVKRFAAGASKRSSKSRPWDGLDPKDRPTSGLNLRLNEYELAMLRYLSEAKDRSIQKTIKRILVPALEAECKSGVE